MKFLAIKKNNLELARVPMYQADLTAGRSPHCDIVLRAPGIAPVHFLLEWAGIGTFDSNQLEWAIFDVSSSIEQSGQGIRLTEKGATFQDFKFEWVESTLEPSLFSGGTIRAELEKTQARLMVKRGGSKIISILPPTVLELVQLRADTGMVEEILHVFPQKQKKSMSPLAMFPEFKLEISPIHDQTKAGALTTLLASELPGAKFFMKGHEIEATSQVEIRGGDLLKVIWQDRTFYLRFVPEVDLPPQRSRFLSDPMLAGMALIGLLCLGILTYWSFSIPEEKKETPPAPRVATIEIQDLKPPEKIPEPPKPVEPPPPPKEEPIQAVEPKAAPAPKPKVEPKPNPLTPKNAPPKETKGGAPAAPKFVSKDKDPGLSPPVPKKDVNKLGLLGGLAGSAPKGPGVALDKIANPVVTNAVSGSEKNLAQKVQTNATGDLGTGNSGSLKGGKNLLAGAATTGGGGDKYNPKAQGAISGSGGSGNGLGASGLSSAGLGNSDSGGVGYGSLKDTGLSIDVSGGLDRDTVKSIVATYKSQITACYNRALLSQPKLKGTVVVSWKILPSGNVATADIKRTEANSPLLEGCIKNIVLSMVFPKATNNQSTIVNYPFGFASGKK